MKEQERKAKGKKGTLHSARELWYNTLQLWNYGTQTNTPGT